MTSTNPNSNSNAGTNGAGGNDPQSGAEMAAVAGLAREVEGLARGVEAMRKAMQLTATAGEVQRLAKVVEELSQTTANGLRGGGGEADPPESWLYFQGSAQAAGTRLADLTSWLAGIYLRYPDGDESLPECWLWHPEIVEELLWLMQAWLAAYVDDGACVRLAGDWHDRLRPGVARRITGYAGTCSLDNHVGRRAKAAPLVPVADAADAIGAWWADHRDQPAPEPTTEQMDVAAQAWRRNHHATTNGGTP